MEGENPIRLIISSDNIDGKGFHIGRVILHFIGNSKKGFAPFPKFGNLQWLSGCVGPYNTSYMHENIENVRDQRGIEVLHEKWLKIDQTLV